MKHRSTIALALALGLTLLALPAGAARIRDLCEVQGAQENSLKGVGIVVGLAGTGDKAKAAMVAQERLLERMNVEITSFGELKSDNVAVVMVTAMLPPFAKPGTRIDVLVSSIYDCKSLEGGTLLETLMFGIDNEAYAVAQGPISVGGFNAGSSGSSVRKNHVTAGRIPEGGSVEREVPATITDGERVSFLLREPDFTTASRIVQAVDKLAGTGAASALGAGTVNVKIPPKEAGDLVGFIAKIQDLVIQPGTSARVVINERTGTIVVGGDATIKPCQVAHGSLSITIATQPQVSQPAPFSQGVTVATTQSDISAQEDEAFLMPVGGTSAGEVAEALNKLKVTPRDMIAIFQALREAGALDAELEIM